MRQKDIGQKCAGIVIVNSTYDKILCLRTYASYDLPKGHIEKNESELEAAERETFEETGIDQVKFVWGKQTFKVVKKNKKTKQVIFFIGISDIEPKINKNPKTGKYEHHGYSWLTFSEAENKLHEYLRPVIQWVIKVISENINE